ncbi:uncharacterized protein [Nicotiana tomentosiformis]|uniref:uncharacterized protein n=1 Tax=Nicotiana tomentosiformis TaxID=4098 RepID=UPI00388CE959
MLEEALTAKEQSNEGAHGADDPLHSFFEGVDSAALEDFTGLGDLEVPRKQSSSKIDGLNLSPKLINQIPALSMDPNRKRSIIITVPEDARVLSTPVRVASHLWCLVTEEDHAKMSEVDVPCFFNEAQQALNRELAEKSETYKFLYEQHKGVIKSLQAKLDTAQKEHADLVEHIKIFEVSNDDLAMVTNDQTLQVQQKIDRIDQLRAEMNDIQVLANVWKGKMDRLVSKKETAREQLASLEVQLRVAKEKADTRARRIEDLQAQLGSAIAERNAFGKELEITRSESEISSVDAEEMVAQYMADIKAAEARQKVIVEYVKWMSRRETLEEIHARVLTCRPRSKRLEVEAKKLADLEGEESSEGSVELEDREDPDGYDDEAGSGGDQA